MAVQKSRKTPSKRGMHRSHSALQPRRYRSTPRAARPIRGIAFRVMDFIAAARCFQTKADIAASESDE